MTELMPHTTPATYATTAAIPSSMQFGAGRPARENAAHLEEFFGQRANGSDGFLGADGVYSTAIDGRTVFAFGDTFIGGRVLGRQIPGNRYSFMRNSFGVADGNEFRIVGPELSTRLRNKRDWLTPSDANIPLVGSKDWYWPGAMNVDASGLHVFLGQFHQGSLDVKWGWSHTGTRLATIDPKTFALRSVIAVNDDASTIWGAASLATPDHLYMYGSARAASGAATSLKVARTKGTDASRGWEYLTQDGSWSDDALRAVGNPVPVGGQFSVIANPRGGVDLISQDGFTPQLAVTHGAGPAGPWDAAHASKLDLPAAVAPKYIYNAVVHESLSDADRLVVSVNQNTFSIPQLILHPQLYRPHFFTIARPGSAGFSAEQSATWGA